MLFVSGHFPRILLCFLRRRMRSLVVNRTPAATNTPWTSRRCVWSTSWVISMSDNSKGCGCVRLSLFFLHVRDHCCSFCCFTVRSDSRQWEPDSFLVWSDRPVILYRNPSLLHHRLPWRYTQTYICPSILGRTFADSLLIPTLSITAKCLPPHAQL